MDGSLKLEGTDLRCEGKDLMGSREAGFSTQGGAYIWNEAPEEAVKVGTITTVKIHLDCYMDRKGLKDVGQMHSNGTSCGRHLG